MVSSEIWGASSFDNGEAVEWLYRLGEKAELGPVRRALARVDDDDEYLDETDCKLALAAAEVVAAMRGRPSGDLPGEVEAWARSCGKKCSDRLLKLAMRVVNRIRTDSELRDIWVESGEEAAWFCEVDDLLVRLDPRDHASAEGMGADGASRQGRLPGELYSSQRDTTQS
jgi:hypothetical protein